MKHVGKMKNNGAKVVIAYRTLPGDPYSTLVIGTQNLGDAYHDALMSAVQSERGQQANELADVLAVRKFPDGSNMLEWFHKNGLLRKVSTESVLVTPTPRPEDAHPLSAVNEAIAQAKGITLEELAVAEEGAVRSDPSKTTSSSVNEGESAEIVSSTVEETLSPAALRSKADKLFKEAQALRKQADALDPPKSKKKETAAVE